MNKDGIIYLDYAATTPVDRAVLQTMLRVEQEAWGNSSSAHRFGRAAAAALEDATGSLSRLLDVLSEDILYTSGATESNAIVMTSVLQLGRNRRIHIVLSAFEHSSILNWKAHLEREGVEVSIVPPSPDGVIQVEAVESVIRPNTVLVSIMAVQNELGTIQPIEQLSQLLRPRGILLHTDAAQAAGRVSLNHLTKSADLVSLSAHKCYGPKGIGALISSPATERFIKPVAFGGGQQRGLRPGTIPTALVAGFVKALCLGAKRFSSSHKQLRENEELLLHSIRKTFHAARRVADASLCAPGIMNVWFPGVSAERLLGHVTNLAVSTGSACHSGSWAPSHVLMSIGLDESMAGECLRISVGRDTSASDVERAGAQFGQAAFALSSLREVKYG